MILIFTEIQLGISIIVPAGILKPFKSGFAEKLRAQHKPLLGLVEC